MWITTYLPTGYKRKEAEDSTQKIAAGSFVCMKEDVTATSHIQGLELPSNLVTTHMCITSMTK